MELDNVYKIKSCFYNIQYARAGITILTSKISKKSHQNQKCPIHCLEKPYFRGGSNIGTHYTYYESSNDILVEQML